jgi:hypothetical protein
VPPFHFGASFRLVGIQQPEDDVGSAQGEAHSEAVSGEHATQGKHLRISQIILDDS